MTSHTKSSLIAWWVMPANHYDDSCNKVRDYAAGRGSPVETQWHDVTTRVLASGMGKNSDALSHKVTVQHSWLCRIHFYNKNHIYLSTTVSASKEYNDTKNNVLTKGIHSLPRNKAQQTYVPITSPSIDELAYLITNTTNGPSTLTGSR